jgi:hypothetical protein
VNPIGHVRPITGATRRNRNTDEPRWLKTLFNRNSLNACGSQRSDELEDDLDSPVLTTGVNTEAGGCIAITLRPTVTGICNLPITPLEIGLAAIT